MSCDLGLVLEHVADGGFEVFIGERRVCAGRLSRGGQDREYVNKTAMAAGCWVGIGVSWVFHSCGSKSIVEASLNSTRKRPGGEEPRAVEAGS